jgi:CheY-like chemotaxis protein
VAALDSSRDSTPSLLVLVVDDSRVSRRLASLMLARCGCRVEIARNGFEALCVLAAHPVDLVLMDVQMTGLDGPRTTARLRGLGHRTPVVALTAGSQSEEWQRCEAAGMNDYLAKPFRLPELVRILEKWGTLSPG